jgi:hypothetical protein
VRLENGRTVLAAAAAAAELLLPGMFTCVSNACRGVELPKQLQQSFGGAHQRPPNGAARTIGSVSTRPVKNGRHIARGTHGVFVQRDRRRRRANEFALIHSARVRHTGGHLRVAVRPAIVGDRIESRQPTTAQRSDRAANTTSDRRKGEGLESGE